MSNHDHMGATEAYSEPYWRDDAEIDIPDDVDSGKSLEFVCPDCDNVLPEGRITINGNGQVVFTVQCPNCGFMDTF